MRTWHDKNNPAYFFSNISIASFDSLFPFPFIVTILADTHSEPTRLALLIIFAKSKYLMMFSFDVSRQWIAIAEVYEYFNNTAERKIKKYNYNVKGSTEVLYQGWLKHLWGKLYSMRTLTKTFLSLFSVPQSLSKEVNCLEDFWIACTFNQFSRWWLKTR